jgi:ribosomal-protein-alanine N-acetyltransferase
MIRTERLLLRRARPDDLDALHAILTDRRAMRYWSTPPHTTLAETQEWLDRMIDGPPAESDDYIVELDGRAIGKAGCYRLPEIGYILHPDNWGKGYIREAMTAIIAHIFATRDIERLVADVDPRNDASIGLLLRLGFVETHRARGTWQVGEELCDSVYFALARPPGNNG